MKNKSAFLIFPHQLFQDLSLLGRADEIYLVEEFLFFNQYKFHKQKLVLHRASMKYYEDWLQKKGLVVHYLEATEKESEIRILLENLAQKGIKELHFYDVCDNWLEKRLRKSCQEKGIELIEYPTPLFLNTKDELKTYFSGRKKYFQSDFYQQQRKRLKILVDEKNRPLGGKWSFDSENRLKYPKDKTPPKVIFPEPNTFYQEAIDYVEKNYPENYGKISREFIYPVTHQESEVWLEQFLEKRFFEFGKYEDAIVDQETILNHSLLSPLLNIGLLLPLQVVKAALDFAEKNDLPVNSLEGFIRQIIGWREFIRGVYLYVGTKERTMNYWKFAKPLPETFYQANTGIEPLDRTIEKVLDTAYCHHIERLMILGNFMLLAEINPDQVYQWFMELFIDAYDWVMVPNVYGMSQFADGGMMATKPYISGSSYILKMSNYKKGKWCEVWDALFWHFMNKYREFFLANPRLGMLIKTYDKMSDEKKNNLEKIRVVFETNPRLAGS